MKGLEPGIEIVDWPPGADLTGYKNVTVAVEGRPVHFSFPVQHLEGFATEEALGQWLSRAARTSLDFERSGGSDPALVN